MLAQSDGYNFGIPYRGKPGHTDIHAVLEVVNTLLGSLDFVEQFLAANSVFQSVCHAFLLLVT
jgi:hypothetical protein